MRVRIPRLDCLGLIEAGTVIIDTVGTGLDSEA